jgi:hypothetical protein
LPTCPHESDTVQIVCKQWCNRTLKNGRKNRPWKLARNASPFTFLLAAGDEVLEWNGRTLSHKSYDEVHDVIAESRHDSQVELRVSRMLTTPAAAAAAAAAAGHPLRGPASSRAPPGSIGRPSVTVCDPLGHSDTLMLNPMRGNNGAPVGTRIQVGRTRKLTYWGPVTLGGGGE